MLTYVKISYILASKVFALSIADIIDHYIIDLKDRDISTKFITLVSYNGEKYDNRARCCLQNLCLYLIAIPSREKCPVGIYDFVICTTLLK